MENAKQEFLFKGELMEEQLRAYFHDLGYYVVRGIKYKYQGLDITDIDLWLYHRPTSLSRERINVDIKNKKTPAAIERIFWAKGIKEVLGFDKCMVATTDRRDSVRQFGLEHGVTVLDGNFIQKVRSISFTKHSEESFTALLKDDMAKFTTNWVHLYEASKARLIDVLDFRNANLTLIDIKRIIEHIVVSPIQKANLLRLLYSTISHFLIIVDYIMKDMAFVEGSLKAKSLEDGFKYGSVDPIKVHERVSQLAKQTGMSTAAIKMAADEVPVHILRDFFWKNDNSKSLFKWAREFDSAAFKLEVVFPSSLDAELKGVLGMVCDFSGIDRKRILSL